MLISQIKIKPAFEIFDIANLTPPNSTLNWPLKMLTSQIRIVDIDNCEEMLGSCQLVTSKAIFGNKFLGCLFNLH